MRILVTGGTGFVGSGFISLACAMGHAVLSLSRHPPAKPIAGAQYALGSVSEPPWSALEAFQADACVHAAWVATPGIYLESPENRSWVDWSEALLDRVASRGTQRIVVLGTCVEYAITGEVLHEADSRLEPTSAYGQSKAELHRRLAARWTGRDVELAWARLFYPYGGTEHPARLASSLVARFRRGDTVMLQTPHSTKDYIHVDDVAAALLRVTEAGVGGAINIGTGIGVTVEQLARKIAALVGRSDLVRLPEVAAADPLHFVVADVARLHGLGWSQKVSLEDGLRRLVEARAS